MKLKIESSQRFNIPVDLRIRNKIVEILLHNDIDLIEQKKVSSSLEHLSEVKKMIVRGEITQEQLDNVVENIQGPYHEDSDTAERIYAVIVNDQPTFQLATDFVAYFVDDKVKYLRPENIAELLEKYENPRELMDDILESVKDRDEIVRVFDQVAPLMRALYGKKYVYWLQIKQLQEDAQYDFGDLAVNEIETIIYDVEQETNLDNLKQYLQSLYVSVLQQLNSMGIPLNEEIFTNPQYGEVLRSNASIVPAIRRLSELNNGFDNNLINKLRHQALESIIGVSDEVDISDEADTLVESQNRVESFSFREITETESKEILKRTEIHADEYGNRRLQIADLENRDLVPKYEIDLGDLKIVVASNMYDLEHGRVGCVAYVKVGNNYIARSYYQSNSQVSWRYLPNYLYSQVHQKVVWYGKGYSESSIDLPIVLQQALAQIKSMQPPVTIDDPEFIFAGTARDKDLREKGTYCMKIDARPKELDGDFYYVHQDPTKRLYGNKLVPPERMVFDNKNQEPDFSHVLSSWEDETSHYGHIINEVFESRDGAYRYVFSRDDNGRIWISSIEDNSELTSMGIRESWVRGGCLTTPAYEYDQQVGQYGNPLMRHGNYQDMYQNYLSKIEIIKKYVQALNERKEVKDIQYNIPKVSQEIIISESNTFNDLFNNLRVIKALNGKKKVYQAEELIVLIEDVRIGKNDIITITKEAGLRDKVLELLQKEKISKIS